MKKIYVMFVLIILFMMIGIGRVQAQVISFYENEFNAIEFKKVVDEDKMILIKYAKIEVEQDIEKKLYYLRFYDNNKNSKTIEISNDEYLKISNLGDNYTGWWIKAKYYTESYDDEGTMYYLHNISLLQDDDTITGNSAEAEKILSSNKEGFSITSTNRENNFPAEDQKPQNSGGGSSSNSNSKTSGAEEGSATSRKEETKNPSESKTETERL